MMQDLIASADVPEGEIVKVEPSGIPAVAIARHEGKIYVFPDRCPHADESLAEGWLEEGRVVCGVHFAEFDLDNGEVHNPPAGCPALSFYTFEERDGMIVADLAGGAKHV